MHTHIKIAEYITFLLENRFAVGKFRFGLDPVLGTVPVLGDIVTLMLSLYIVWIGLQIRMPEDKVNRMIRHIVTDFILGLFPVIGDLSDFIYKANSKNLKLLKEHVEKNPIIEGKILAQIV